MLGATFGRTYAFVGIERIGGIMVYDVSNPFDPRFAEYEAFPEDGDRGPEGLEFVPAAMTARTC